MLLTLHGTLVSAMVILMWLSAGIVECGLSPSMDWSVVQDQVEKLIRLGGPGFRLRWPGVDEESQIIIQKGVGRWIHTSKFKYLAHISPAQALAFATVPETAVWDNWADRRLGEQTFVILSVYGKSSRLEPHLAPTIHGLFNVAAEDPYAFELWFKHSSEPFIGINKRLKLS